MWIPAHLSFSLHPCHVWSFPTTKKELGVCERQGTWHAVDWRNAVKCLWSKTEDKTISFLDGSIPLATHLSLYVLHRELAGVSIRKLSSAKASMSCFLQTTVLFHLCVTELCFHHSPLSFQRALSPSSPKWRQWSALSSARTLGMSPDSQTSSAPAHSLWGLFAQSSHYLIVNASHLDAGHVCISTYSLFYYLFCL